MTTPQFRDSKKRLSVLGRDLAYVDRGQGEPLLFLHGNPTSSFLWRNVIAPLERRFRCIAPDLVGMGDSEKLDLSGPESYSFETHRRYLDGFIAALALDEPIVLLLHDWGSALGFDWARRQPERVRGIAYMEAIVGEMKFDEWSEPASSLFRRLRSPAGEALILEQNVFVEKVLPGGVLRELDDSELAEYRRPFLTPGDARRPMLAFPRELPIDGSPATTCDLVEGYARWLERCSLPKLFVNAEPGRILTGRLRERCRRWPNQTELTVRGLHFLQEDSAAEIAEGIETWLDGLAEVRGAS